MDKILREMDPERAAAHDLRMSRIRDIQEELKSVPLGSFMASDLGPLMRVQQLERGGLGYVDPKKKDLTILEERLRQIKERS